MHDDISVEGMSAPLKPHASRAYEFLHDGSRIARSVSRALAIVAGAALICNCLLTSPSHFSEKHLNDTSLLKPLIAALGLGGKLPTFRGVEIRDLFFYVGASLLALIAAVRLMTIRKGPGLTFDDLLDLRSRCSGPYFWWVVLLLTAFFSSYYSHAPEMCFGQFKIRLLQTAWWISLGTFLAARHVRGLSIWLVLCLGLTAALGLVYHAYRDDPGRRLQYPIGNELWMAACLLPGIFVAAGLAMGRFSPMAPSRPSGRAVLRTVLLIAAIAVIASAIYLTQSRSAQAGAIAGGIVALAFWFRGAGRRIILLLGIVAALGGSFWVNHLLQTGGVASRAQSLRSRLQYEWPYAIHLFLQKPIAGNGDGAYAMLAGKLEREDQLEDPAIIRFDEWSWPGHAHNEFLELLADVGIVGLIAYLLAIGLTLYRAMQFCDRCPSECVDQRWLTIGLSAALVAMIIDQCFDPSNREPGVSAILFTVWGCLWALCRHEQPVARDSASNEDILRPGTLWVIGGCIAAASIYLGWLGVQNWRASRARFEAMRRMDDRDYQGAIADAQFAGENLFDPFQRAQARMIGVWAGSLAFDNALAKTKGPLTESQMQQSDDTLRQLVKLDEDVPRFLRLSRLGSELHLNRARALERMGDTERMRDAQQKFVSALLANQKDEPFLVDRVVALWKALPDATAMQRLYWLRCLMRGGEVDDTFVQLFRTLPNVKDFAATLQDLYTLALRDADQPRRDWRDRLAPETFRAAALAKALSGDMGEAERLAKVAQGMYAKAGPALSTAYAAAILEEVRYRLAADPTGQTDALLSRLADGYSILEGHVDAKQPLTGRLGDIRLRVLIAAGRESEAKLQLARLGIPEREQDAKLGMAMADVASRYLIARGQNAAGLTTARRAVELAPGAAFAHLALAQALMAAEKPAEAEAEAVIFIRLSPDPKAAQQAWDQLKSHRSTSQP